MHYVSTAERQRIKLRSRYIRNFSLSIMTKEEEEQIKNIRTCKESSLNITINYYYYCYYYCSFTYYLRSKEPRVVITSSELHYAYKSPII